jgi:hypothetical protein
MSIMSVEGSENCAFGARSWFWVVDAVYEKGKSNNIGKEDEFLRQSQRRGLVTPMNFVGSPVGHLYRSGQLV